MKRNSAIICYTGRLLTGLLLFGGVASATLIVPTGVDWNRGSSIWINMDGQNAQTYFAGVVFITLTENGIQYNRDTLCVDLFTDIYIGQTYGTNILDPSEVPGKNLPRVSWLIDNALLPTESFANPFSSLPQADWVRSPSQGAGIQLAIWDIVHDGGDGFGAGRVQASTDPNNPTSADVLTWAQLYESASYGHATNDAFIYDNFDTANGIKAQMLAGPAFRDGGPVAAPEPSTFTLLGSALIVVGMCLRKGIRRQGSAR